MLQVQPALKKSLAFLLLEWRVGFNGVYTWFAVLFESVKYCLSHHGIVGCWSEIQGRYIDRMNLHHLVDLVWDLRWQATIKPFSQRCIPSCPKFCLKVTRWLHLVWVCLSSSSRMLDLIADRWTVCSTSSSPIVGCYFSSSSSDAAMCWLAADASRTPVADC